MRQEKSTPQVSPQLVSPISPLSPGSPATPASPTLLSAIPTPTEPPAAVNEHKIAIITFNAGGVSYCGLGTNVLNCHLPDHATTWAKFAREADVVAIGLQESNVVAPGDGQLDVFERSLGMFGLNRGWLRVVDRALAASGGSKLRRSVRLAVFVATSVYRPPAAVPSGDAWCKSQRAGSYTIEVSPDRGYVWARLILDRSVPGKPGQQPLRLFLATAHFPYDAEKEQSKADYMYGRTKRFQCYYDLVAKARTFEWDACFLFGDLNFHVAEHEVWRQQGVLEPPLRALLGRLRAAEPSGGLSADDLKRLFPVDDVYDARIHAAPHFGEAMSSPTRMIYPTCHLKVNRGDGCRTETELDLEKDQNKSSLMLNCFETKQGKSIPSWCDRILYAVSLYKPSVISLKELRRIDTGNQRLSDHASVFARFDLTLKEPTPSRV